MYTECRDFVMGCEVCQGKSKPKNPIPVLIREMPEAAFEVVSIDFAGPFSVDCKVGVEPRPKRGERDSQRALQPRKLKYCLVIVDKLSCYPILVPVTDTSAKTTIQALKLHLYSVFGTPAVVITDQASCFTSEEMKRHFEEASIEVDLISPENHRSNGLAELTVRLLHEHFGRYPQESLGKWYQELPEVAYSLRTTPCSDNHLTPGEMVFGKPMRNPYVKVPHPLSAYDPLSPSENRQESLVDRKMHRERRLEAGAPPSRQKPVVFQAGDWVRLRSETPVAEAKRRGVPLKWVYRWDERGTVVGPVEGHPNQFIIRKASSGQEVQRSGATLRLTARTEGPAQLSDQGDSKAIEVRSVSGVDGLAGPGPASHPRAYKADGLPVIDRE
jgi:hypothetical protein